jgi:predicted Zn-dependent protease
MRITGGTASTKDLRDTPYLELVSFSDFQVDPVTGDFGSEIRLGFYFDGEKTIPVTGGSISGNMAKINETMRMSIENRQYNNYHGPATICIRDASISSVC